MKSRVAVIVSSITTSWNSSKERRNKGMVDMKLKLKETKDSMYSIVPALYVYNKKNERLGVMFYYKKWKCWAWMQNDEILMSSECLQQVVDKLKEKDKK